MYYLWNRLYMKDIQSHIITTHMNEQKSISFDFLAQWRQEITNAYQDNKHFLNLLSTEIVSLKETFTKQSKLLCCNLCQFETNNRQSLQKHIETVHPTHFTCDFCTFEFDENIKLQKHMRIMHREMHMEYACDHCEFESRNLVT